MANKRELGIILSYLNTFLSMICGLLLSSFLLRLLGDTDYGVYQTMSSFANYLVLLEFGLGTVLARNLSAARARGCSQTEIEKNISTVWSIMSGLCLLIVLISGIFYVLIDTIYSNSLTAQQIADGKAMFVQITVFLVASFVAQTLNGVVLAYEYYTYASVISIIKLLSRTALLVFLVGRLKEAVVICAVDALINVGVAAYTYYFCRKRFALRINCRKFDKAILKGSLPLCLALFLQSIVNQSNSLMGKFVLGVMSGPEDVALYSVGLYIFGIFSSLAGIPVSLYMPKVTKDITSGLEGLELTKTLVPPSRMIVLAGGTVFFGFFACGRQFISIVYGEKYLLAWTIAIALIGPAFFNESVAVVQNVLNVKNKRHVRSLLMMISTAINVVLTIFGVEHFGIVAAAVSTGFSTLLQALIMNLYYSRVIDIKIGYLFRNIFSGILPFQLLGAAAGFAVGAWMPNIYAAFLCAGCTYVLIAFVGFCLFGKNGEERQMMERVFQKITRRKMGA